MIRRLSRLGLVAAIVLLVSGSAPSSRAGEDTLTVLVSIDGFRWDYLEKYDTPVLRALAADGVRARRMTPSFPSKTFPNHFTLVTGLYPGHHGIVGNWFYEPATGEKFTMNRMEPFWWAGGEPIWITAEKQGRKAFCYFWPGSEAEYRGRRASRFLTFDKTQANAQRVDGLLAWLDVPAAEQPRLATLYFDSVDTIGHTFGPDAPETAAAVREADAAIGRLLAGLERLGLRARTNLVIVSDHGMSPCGSDRVIFFEDLMDVATVRIEANGPVGGVRPWQGDAATLAAAIRAKAPPQLTVYLRDETPERWHYRASDRIPPIVLVCADHWCLEEKRTWGAWGPIYSHGSHGWDPATPNMGALFLAAGPAFKHGVVIDDFENIHVYDLLCHLLGVKPAPNDGDDRLAPLTLK